MKCKPAYLSCIALLLVIYVADQLTSVTGHSLKSAAVASRSRTNGGKMMDEIMSAISNKRRHQQKTVTHVRSATPQLVSARLNHSISTQGRSDFAFGVAARSNKLYVGLYISSSIEIYDASTFSLQSRLNVPVNAPGLYDMASCSHCDAVFVLDRSYFFKIHVLDDAGLRALWNTSVRERWPGPTSVSVNSQSNVIIAFLDQKLREYTPSGELVREITLPSDIEYPSYAIQLDNDRYAVCSTSTSSPDRVCIVDGNGSVIQCYGGQRGSGVGQLDHPIHLAIFGESLLVADYGNYRVLQLNARSLSYIGELINTRSEECHPSRLAVNEVDARLYVISMGEECPITVYDLITE